MERLLITLCLTLSLPLPALAADAPASNKKEIVILYPGSKPQEDAIVLAIMRHIEPRLKYRFTFKVLPWARAVETARQGQAGITAFSKTTARQKDFDYSDPLFVAETLLVTLKERTFPFEKMEDLKGKTIGGGTGYSFGDEFERGKRFFKYQEIYGYDNNSIQVGLLKLLLNERIDAAIIGPGRAGLESTIHSDRLLESVKDRFTALPKPFVQDVQYLAFAKSLNMRDFLREFNAELAAANKSGAVKKIIESQISVEQQGGLK